MSKNSAELATDISRARQLLKAERAKVQKRYAEAFLALHAFEIFFCYRDKQVFSKLFSGGGNLYPDAPTPASEKDSKPSEPAASVILIVLT